MKIKTIKTSALLGAIAGLYLTVVFALNIASFGTEIILIIIYYIFNCFLLFSINLLLNKNNTRIAKILITILVISVLVSFFVHFSFLDGGVNLFVFSVMGGIIMGMGKSLPFLGVIPVVLFFWGIISSFTLFFKKREELQLLNSNLTLKNK